MAAAAAVLVCADGTFAAAPGQPAPVQNGGGLGLTVVDLAVVLASIASVVIAARLRWHRLAPTSRAGWGLDPTTLAMFFIGWFLLERVGFNAAGWLTGGAESSDDVEAELRRHVQLGLGRYAGAALVIVATWLHVKQLRKATPASTSPSEARQAPAPTRWPRAALAGIGALVLVWPLVMLVQSIARIVVVWLTSTEPPVLAHETLRSMSDAGWTDPWAMAMVAMVTIGAPITEEFGYRGLIQGLLGAMRFRPWLAIGLTSVVFVVMHIGAVETHALAGLFVLSLGFGWIYERTGSIAAPIAMHVAFNACNVMLAVLLP